MKFRTNLVLTLCGVALSFSGAKLHAETWTVVGDPAEVHQLVVDRALDGKYWKYYFRSDGRMAYEQDGFISVREWTINDDGTICMNIYSMPDKIVGCETLSRTDETPARYRLEGQTGLSAVEFVAPDQSLIDAALERAGAVE